MEVMQTKKIAYGHAAAFFTILIWGTTFISTKVLLDTFGPIEILFYRFALGYGALWLVYPHRMKITDRKHEFWFAGAGLCGVTLYYLMENIALTLSSVANVSIIVSISPLFTGLILHFVVRGGQRLKPSFLVGFAAALVGIVLITLNGSAVLNLNPIGDFLALISAVGWGAYSVITRRISQLDYPAVGVTRRIFFYGVLFMLPASLFYPVTWNFRGWLEPVPLMNLLFLGLVASALCFLSWNQALKVLGALKTSLYTYAVPVVAVVTGVIVLHESITFVTAVGAALTLVGLFISDGKLPLGRKKTAEPVAEATAELPVQCPAEPPALASEADKEEQTPAER